VIWYLDDPGRFRQEREALGKLAAETIWLVPGQWRMDEMLRLVWEGEVMVGEKAWPVSMRYPNHFPHSPPLVLPRDEKARWSGHQYGAGGELCLEYGADGEWRTAEPKSDTRPPR
jgi:hypothetical protein